MEIRIRSRPVIPAPAGIQSIASQPVSDSALSVCSVVNPLRSFGLNRLRMNQASATAHQLRENVFVWPFIPKDEHVRHTNNRLNHSSYHSIANPTRSNSKNHRIIPHTHHPIPAADRLNPPDHALRIDNTLHNRQMDRMQSSFVRAHLQFPHVHSQIACAHLSTDDVHSQGG